ncbi:uncharacterized protein LOC134240154 [Saccostrea cucullata]|uniref:uncharacterized protein LOC134240154 n=1 Tax=Saccostrea cuccullata TaxID=36930 RepID=UPI002ED00D84
MGRQIGNLTFLDTTQEEYTYIYTTGPIKRFESTRRNFICEMSPEYVGCFLSNDSFPVVLTSDTMTIELCVETCRIRNTTYALLSPSECRCNDTHLMNTSKSCKSRCANSKIQICGDSASSVSVYKIDEYSLYSSCETLFDSGIRIHGYYALKDGIQYCKFYDGSADCEEGWYALNGTCYSVLLNSTTGYGYQPILEWRSACAQQGGRLVSINNQEQHLFIAKVIMGSERLVKSVVLLGYFESILLGAPSWTSGSMSKYMIDAYFSGDSYQERALFQDQKYLNTVIGTSSDTPQASAAVCETEKDFVGVFQQPTNLVPLILRYGIMTLTQCKQVCVGADQRFAMVGRDTCWCGNSTDVDSLTLDFSGASKRRTGTNETFCQGNNIQRCPDGEKVDVYNLEYDNEYTAFSCDHLYSHGVFYNATYTIQNENGTSKQTCGFTDQTDCQSVPMFWGYRDHCYRFGTMLTSGETFTSQCIESDSLPFFPAENDELVSVLKLIVPVFQSETHLFIGTSNRLHNNHYTSSEGFFVRSHPDVTFNGSIGYMTLKMDTFEWEEASGKHFGICKSPVNGSIRCIAINSLNGSLLFEHQNIYPMTSSICIQLCLGRNASYGVVREQGCLCYANLTYEKKIGECKACSGHETQMCGDDSKGSGVLVDLDYYREETVQSCEELYSYGINIPGQYFIQRNGTSYLVTCFDRDPSLSVITDYSITTSTESGISNEDYRINVYTNYNTDSSWKPEFSDTEPQIKFTFTEDYILTAIQTQGDVVTESWVTSYKLIYKNLENEDIDVSINGSTNITGNIDRYSRVTQFFSQPIITRELRLYPLSHQQRVSLRVSLYGQPLSLFNHSTTYLGCFLNVEGDIVVQSLVSSEEGCRTTCKALYYQFYSFYENQDSSRHCFCGKSLYVYGTVQDNWCFPFTNSPALPVNRTYDTHCEEKIEEEASFISSFHPHSIDFFTLTSQIQFECNPGYILSNNATLKTVTCQETDGEYYWKDELGKCIVKNCSLLELPDTGYTLSTNNVTFGTVVTVTCNNSLHMADGSGSKTVTCLSTAQWNDSVSSCSYNYCPSFPPTLPNGVYVLSQNTLSATFTCNQFYTLSSLKSQETISCQQNHQWEAINFTCEVNDSAVIFKQAEFDLIGLYERPGPADSVITEAVFSSIFKCTDKCVKTRHCTAYAYNMQGGVCILFKSRVKISDLIPTSSWKYFELKLIVME